MGQIIECSCDKCGYSKKHLFLGSGKTRGHSYFPSLDSKSKSVVQIDTSDLIELVDRRALVVNMNELNRLKDDGKTPYFVKGMYKKRLFSGKPISTAPLYLQSKSNLCPNCNKFKLTFLFGGLFD
jgi:hypothetical protein